MKTIIGIFTKSPHPQGRIGPEHFQDWYRQCVDVIALHKKTPESEIVVTSALHVTGAEREEDYYTRVIHALGDEVKTLGRGVETIEQIEAFKEYAASDRPPVCLILSVTFTHYLRVSWLCFRARLPARFIISWGIPRPKELVTDIILTLLYPVLDILGMNEWFKQKVQKRRKSGTF